MPEFLTVRGRIWKNFWRRLLNFPMGHHPWQWDINLEGYLCSPKSNRNKRHRVTKIQALDCTCTLDTLYHSYFKERVAGKTVCFRKCNQKQFFFFFGMFCCYRYLSPICLFVWFLVWQSGPLGKAAFKNRLKVELAPLFLHLFSPIHPLVSRLFQKSWALKAFLPSIIDYSGALLDQAAFLWGK